MITKIGAYVALQKTDAAGVIQYAKQVFGNSVPFAIVCGNAVYAQNDASNPEPGVQNLTKKLNMRSSGIRYKHIPLQDSRSMLSKVRNFAHNASVPVFCIAPGASITDNNGNAAVRDARSIHASWETAHGSDPSETWEKTTR